MCACFTRTLFFRTTLGFVRIGRQPFDWGLGILANGGHDPAFGSWFRSRQGSLVKVLPGWSWNLYSWFSYLTYSATVASLFAGDSGVGYDILAAAGIYNQQMGDVNVTVGAYGFPYLHQNNVFSGGSAGSAWDVDRTSGSTPVFLSLSLLTWSFHLRSSDVRRGRNNQSRVATSARE